MAHLRISLVIDIKAEAAEIQAAALATPMYTDGEPGLNAPVGITQDPVNAGHILAVAIQNDLADKIKHGNVTLTDLQVQSVDE